MSSIFYVSLDECYAVVYSSTSVRVIAQHTNGKYFDWVYEYDDYSMNPFITIKIYDNIPVIEEGVCKYISNDYYKSIEGKDIIDEVNKELKWYIKGKNIHFRGEN